MYSIKRCSKKRGFALSLFAPAGLALINSANLRADATWDVDVGDGSWSTPSNWVGHDVPTDGNVTISFNDSASHLITYDGNLSSDGSVLLGNLGSGVATLALNGGYSLSATILEVGGDGRGNVTQSAGTIKASVHLVGMNGGSGTYLLNDGTLLSDSLYIGNAGTGYFHQSGGTVVSNIEVFIGREDSGGNGTLLISGGVFQSHNAGETINSGTIIQTGGTHIVDGLGLFIANRFGTNSAYQMMGGTLNVLGILDISFVPAFFQTGGTVNVLGDSPPNTPWGGGYLHDQGYVLSGGVLNVDGLETALNHVQTGGTQTIGKLGTPGELDVSGTFSLSGTGVLDVLGLEGLGEQYPNHPANAGTFFQSGGGHFVGDGAMPGTLDLGRYSGGRGTVRLKGGSLAVIGQEFIAGLGTGTFIQTNGYHSVTGDAYIASDAGGKGLYTASSGSAALDNLYIGGGSVSPGGFGSLVLSGATMSVGGNLKLWPTGTIIYSGGSLTAGSLAVSGGHILLTLGSGTTLRVHSVTTESGGIVDLADNSMVIDYGGGALFAPAVVSSPLDDVVAQLGNGIITSISVTDPNKRIGYSDDGTNITLKLAFGGDANLDGIVNFTDLQLLDDHWEQSGYWSGGDFDYNRLVNITDLYILAPNWNDSTPLSDALAQLGLPQVPEPALCMAFMIAPLFIRRRRNRGFGHT
jgi:hypothetical protein